MNVPRCLSAEFIDFFCSYRLRAVIFNCPFSYYVPNNHIIMSKIKAAYDAIREGRIENLEQLLRDDLALLNTQTPFGPLLHVACGAGNLEAVKLLLSCGADIDARGGTFGGDALNYAASKAHVEVCKFLLSQGAKFDISEPEKNALFSAIYVGSAELVELFLDSGIDYSVAYTGQSMTNMDARAFAIERGQKEALAVLLAQ